MALTRHTRTKVGIQEIPLYGTGRTIYMGLPYPATFTNYNVSQRWVGSSREPSYPGSVAYFTYYYGYVDWSATVSGGGITISTSGQMKSGRMNNENSAQWWANTNNPSNVSLTVGSQYPISGGSTPQGKVITYEEEYYTGKVTVKAVLDNGAEQTISETEYNEDEVVTVPIPNAFKNCVLSGVTIDGGSQSTYNPDGYTVTINDNHVIIFRFTSTVEITLAIGNGGKKISGESTTNFTNEKTSKTITSGTGKFVVEVGQNIKLTAESNTNFVLHNNAIVSSKSGYGTMNGTGTTSATFNKICTVATTFTVQGAQYYVTPSIVDGGVGKSTWGKAKIRKQGTSAWSETAILLNPNTTYELGFESSTASTLAAAVDYWNVGGTVYRTTTFTTELTITGDISASLFLKQTKWKLTVANGTDASWGTVSGGGWFASGTQVQITFTPTAPNIVPTAYQVNYNGSTTSCGNTATITTTNESLTATFYLKQTKFLMSVAYGNAGTEGWGTIKANKSYVGTGDQVTLTYTPNSSLVSTIHPKVDHWTFLQQTESPVADDDGSSSVTVTLGTVASNFTAYAYLASSWRKVSIVRGDSLPANWGKFYLDASGTVTEKYYAPGSTITMRFQRDTSFDSNVRPQVNGIVIGTESDIVGVDGTFSYTYQLPANTKTDLVITASMKQTAWPVKVKTDGHGSLNVKRMQVGGGVIASVTATDATEKTIYVRPGTSFEYLATITTPNDHYLFDAFAVTNLSETAPGQYVLASNNSGSISASFTRSDFKITCTTDDTVRASAYLQSDAKAEGYFDKLTTQNPVVICKIKQAYAHDYKVASWTIGAQSGITPQYNAQGDFYYVEVTNRTDVTVQAHIVRTSFNLNVQVGPANKDQFGTIIVSGGGQQLSEGDYSGTLREGTHVEIVFYQKYGGRVLQIQPSAEIAQPAITDKSIAFDMPSADCSVAITLGTKETYNLTIGVVNSSPGEQANIPATLKLRSRTYPSIVIGATGEDGVAKTFTVYKDEEYTIFAEQISEYLTRRYRFTGWKDESGQFIEGADADSINILNNTTSPKTRTAVYSLRDVGTVTVEYAQKEGGTITTLDEIPAGCSFTLNNTKDKTDETHWLIGSDIKMPYTVMGVGYDDNGDAYKWTPVEVDVALATDEYATNATWDDGLLTQDGEFTMRGNMKVRVVFVLTHVPGFTSMNVGFKGGTTALMGSVSLFATEMDAYTTDSKGAKALVRKEKKAVIMAAPRPGFAFAGWFTLVEGVYTAVPGAKAVYEIPYVTSPMAVYYAEFVASTVSNVKMWNGDPKKNKTFDWQSKVYVGAQFFSMQTVRVYADAYPVTLKCFGASSPEDIFGESARTCTVTINNQWPRRLPKMRPEKYFAFRVSGYARINHVGIASSAGGLYGANV